MLNDIEPDEFSKGSPDHQAMIPYWQMVDDFINGSDTVIAAGEMYLPKFPHESDKDYKFRQSCAVFNNIFSDVCENLSSKPFEKEISNKATGTSSNIDLFIEDVDGSGINLNGFAIDLFFRGITSAVDFIHVDYTKAEVLNRPRTIDEEKQLGLRPFWTHIAAINVLDIQTKLIDGAKQISFIKIFEPGSPDAIRMIKYDEQNRVEWGLYHRKKEAEKYTWQLEEAGFITIGVIPVVPFITGRRIGNSWRFIPSMKNAADMQKRLYLMESDLEYAKKKCAHPLLVAQGINPDRDAGGAIKAIPVGPGMVLYAPPDSEGRHGDWKYIEPDAASLRFLSEDIDKFINKMREIGRQPLTAQSGNITVITSAIASGKARSAVAMWAKGLEQALEQALEYTALWFNEPTYEADLEVFTEFDDFTDGATDQQTLLTLRSNGDLSLETLYAELQRRNVLGSDFSAVGEVELLLNEIPSDSGTGLI